MNYKWSEMVFQKMDKYRKVMFEAERFIWEHPQTGFKEWEAHNYLKEKLTDMGFELTEAGDIPGFYFDINTGKEGPVVAIVGELDALIVSEHPESNSQTGAVHACGHNCQVSALLGVAGVLSETGILSELCGKIRIVAVPAEELIELNERANMRTEGKIKFLSGKSEFMRRGYFDGVDIAMMIHTDGGEKPGLFIGIGTSGIMAKRITYYGSKNVNGATPVNGINALYAAQNAMSAINALRETFPHKQNVRNHSIITEGGTSVVHMPSKVVIESHIRAYDYEVLKTVNEKINRAYAAVALAFGAQVTIEDLELYMPENDCNNSQLVQIAYEVGCDLLGQENVKINRERDRRSPGGTDMGNLGAVIPVIQPYSTGAVGMALSSDYQIEYPEYAVLHPAAVQAAIACALLENGGEKARKVIAEYKPVFSSIEEYCEEMEMVYRIKKPVKYNEDDSATLTWS